MTSPAPLPGFTPRAMQSPSALRADADCPSLWGRGYLEGRREASIAFPDLPPPPPKAAKNASAVEKKRAAKALTAYNHMMRPALGTAVHAIGEALYLQRTPGAWHAPRLWVDLAVAWETRPGQIFMLGRQHLPDPASLAAVWCEELVTLEPVHDDDCAMGLGGACDCFANYWPKLGGTPDLVTLELGALLSDGSRMRPARYHLYDYKTTLSFEYAKTAEQLRDEDEQAAIYSLAVMQKHGLDSLECTWIYMRTEGAPASIAVHFTMARAHAEARCLVLARRAAELEAITAEYLSAPRGFLGEAKRLAVINALPTNESACSNYGGCVYHKKAGGPCAPKKQGLGSALKAAAKKQATKRGRREAAKETRDMLTEKQQARRAEIMAIPEGDRAFAQKRELLKLDEAAGDGAAEAPKEIEATGEEVKEAPAKPATKQADPVGTKAQAQAAKAKADDGAAVTCSAGGYSLELPAKSPLYKAIVKACKAQQAADAAIMGE